MAKRLTLLLNTSTYSYEHIYTTTKIAEAALARGLETYLFASADEIYYFVV